MSNGGILDIDSMLDESVDGTESAPDFVTPPNGKYRLATKSAKLVKGEKKNKTTGVLEVSHRIQVIIAVAKTTEIDEKDVPVADGSLFSQGFMWTEQGKGFFKAFCEKILGVEACKGATWKQLIAECNNRHEFDARVRVKESDEFTNINLNDITPVA